MEEIGKRMQQLRKEFGLTQIEFAQRIGVTNAHISKIEKGKTVPSESLIKLICKELNINENWLKYGEEPMEIDMLKALTEYSLIQSTKDFNQLLKLENPVERAKVAQIYMRMNQMLEINIDDDQMLEYLNICAQLFKIIESAVTECKSGLHEDPNQLTLTPNAFQHSISKKCLEIKSVLMKLHEFCKNV